MKTIPALFLEQARIRPEKPGYYERIDGRWVPTSWKGYVDQTRRAARAMIALGMEPGDTVAILGFNNAEWAIFDIASMCVGGAPAGIYTTCSPSEVSYIIGHAEAKLVLLENKAQWEKVNAERAKLPKLEHVIMMSKSEPIEDELVMTWEQFMAKAEGTPENVVDERVAALELAQLATLIYTSGTTGPPKGVMLSHENLAWTASCALSLTDVNEADWGISYLPLSHIAEQMFTLHIPLTSGASVYFAESIERLADNLKEVQPTYFFGVPRIWEKIHAGIAGKLAGAPPMKKKLVTWAMGVGTEVSSYKALGKPLPFFTNLKYALANKLIFSKLKPAIGMGKLKIGVSAAAPISREVLEFFASLDLIVNEVYGQSEGSGPTTFNAPGAVRLGTVGQALPGVDLKIADDGEILVKGPNVFLGYLKEEEATAETLNDGWLFSGDLGVLDDAGYLNITGRKKELIITAGGKNIAPKNIEAALKNFDLITEAVVIGDRRKYLSALVCLEPEAAKRFAQENGLEVENLHKAPKLTAEIQKIVDAINPEFARVEQIKRFVVLPRPLTVEDSELTPTLKVKRRVINEKYADEIESMYLGAD